MYLEAFYGLPIGWNCALALKKEAEIRQGEGQYKDYQACGYQIQGLSSFTTLASNILSQIPYSPLQTGAQITNSLLPVAGLVLLPISAAVKEGHYEQGVQVFDTFIENKCPTFAGILPKELDETRVKVLSFLADHTGTMTTVGLTVGTCALPFFGLGSLAVGIGAPVLYQALDSKGYIPSCISSTMEKYMPTVVNASMLLGGGPFSKAIALATLSSGMPGASDYVQKKIQKTFLKNVKGPTLEEIDAPWIEKQNLSFDEINYILDNHDRDFYEINAAHCSKEVYSTLNDLPQDHHFLRLLSLFRKIDWTQRYEVLKRGLRDDNRFLAFLKEKFGEQNFKEDFEIYIEKLALEANLSKEEYLAKQLSDQMNDLVAILCKEKVVAGFAADLDDAILSCSYILGYILNKPYDVEFEDILIKLAIEGGNYCARGIKRTSSEILSGIMATMLPETENPQKSYELKIRQSLQQMRQQIMQNIYQKLIEIMVRLPRDGNGVFISHDQTTDAQSVAIAQDVHTMDIYRQYLSLGFFPLTANERYRFGLVDFATWSMYGQIRNQMYDHYRTILDEAITTHGELYFADYMRQKINGMALTDVQKEALIDKLMDYEDPEKTMKSFHRLFFVMQGILTVRTVYSDWVDVPEADSNTSAQALNDELLEWTLIEKGTL